MLGYITLGTNDLERACAFYDELLGSIGDKRIFDQNGFVTWGKSMKHPGFAVTCPHDGEPATVGNGVMAAFNMATHEEVDAFYAKAMALGATDEGAPGARTSNFYAGYFRDLDGNKLNGFCFG